MNTKIFTFALLPVIGFLFYLLVDGVKGPIDEKADIEKKEKAIAEKLKFLREAQIAYEGVKGYYAGTWKDLKDFLDNGQILIIDKKEETIFNNDTQTEDVIVTYDTLGTKPASDYIREKYAREEMDDSKLDEYFADPSVIPWSKNQDQRYQFTLYAGKVFSGDLELSVFEVRDEYPLDTDRGGERQDNGQPFSITRLIKHFQDKLDGKTEEAKGLLREKKDAEEAGDEGKVEDLEIKLEELSKFINLYDKRIERLNTRPLRVGSREEATTSGNWE